MVNFMHPHAIPENKSGAFGMKAGDKVRYTINNKTGIADEFLSDGDAYITWDDGSYGIVKWNYLVPECHMDDLNAAS